MQKLRHWIRDHSTDIYKAIQEDLGRHYAETEITEIKPLLLEIRYVIRHLRQWMKPTQVAAPLFLSGTRSRIEYEPKGVCLILAPWNFPFQLVVGPLVSALAAGNCVIIKPSEHAPNTAGLLEKMVAELFPPEEVVLLQGDEQLGESLSKLPFDHIFFTGSQAVGKAVMKCAAENLTPVTLELSGINPVIIHPSANLQDAADKLVVACFVNAGQMCVSPNHVFVHQSVYAEFQQTLVIAADKRFLIKEMHHAGNPNIGKIINRTQWDRLNALIEQAISAGAKELLSGSRDKEKLFISPSILADVSIESPILKTEIFGPVMPIVPFEDIDQVINHVRQNDVPLASYVFARSRKCIRKIIEAFPAGGTCVNDTSIHYYHSGLPFGGFRQSGIGKAHGHAGFLTFSHQRPVLKQRSRLATIKMVYPPYTKFKTKVIRFVSRYI